MYKTDEDTATQGTRNLAGKEVQYGCGIIQNVGTRLSYDYFLICDESRKEAHPEPMLH